MKKDGLTNRQLAALAAVAFQAPALWMLPGLGTRIAGNAAWLSPAAALPVLLLVALLLSAALRKRRRGEGLGGVILRAFGRTFGRVVLFVSALWLLLIAAFILRSAAERFIDTIYPDSGAGVFICVMLALSLLAALGGTRALGRAAELFLPPLLAVLVIILLVALVGAKLELLLPITESNITPVLLGAVPTASAGCLPLVCAAFLEGLSEKRERRFSRWAGLCCAACVLTSLLTAAVLTRFGATLTADLAHPVFLLVRNLTLFGADLRIEALISTLWVLPDYILISVSLIAGADCLRRAAGFEPEAEARRLTELKNGRWLIWVSAAAAAAAAAFMAPTEFKLLAISSGVMPAANLAFALGLTALTLTVGKLRGKL